MAEIPITDSSISLNDSVSSPLAQTNKTHTLHSTSAGSSETERDHTDDNSITKKSGRKRTSILRKSGRSKKKKNVHFSDPLSKYSDYESDDNYGNVTSVPETPNLCP